MAKEHASTAGRRARSRPRRDGDVHVQQYGAEVGPALAAAFADGFGFQASGASRVLPRQLIIARISPTTPLSPGDHMALTTACASAWLTHIVGRVYLVLDWADWERVPAAVDALRRAGFTMSLATALRASLPPLDVSGGGPPFSLALVEACAIEAAWRDHGCPACDAGSVERPAACYQALAEQLAGTSRGAWVVPENWSSAAGRALAGALAPHLPARAWWGARHDASCVAHGVLHRGPVGSWAAFDPRSGADIEEVFAPRTGAMTVHMVLDS